MLESKGGEEEGGGVEPKKSREIKAVSEFRMISKPEMNIRQAVGICITVASMMLYHAKLVAYTPAATVMMIGVGVFNTGWRSQ